MKYGSRLKSDLYPEWAPFYINYSGLKKKLKQPASENKEWDDLDEASFKEILQRELTKISAFQQEKRQEIRDRLVQYEASIEELVQRQHEHEHEEHEEHDHHETDVEHHAADDDDEGSIFGDTTEDDFLALEEALEGLIWETHEISKFQAINYTGFLKITKKHDKMTPFRLRAEFVREYVEKDGFHKKSYDEMIINLSKLYNLVRTRGHPVQGDSAAGGGQSDFIRQTTKYWVHKDNLVNLKLAILKHLPVLVFDPNKNYDQEDASISSIYFDNEDLDLYLGRLEKTEGAQAVRLRWYGGMNIKQIFVERKTHREDWTGEKSIKARFPIKEDQVNAYLRGEVDVDAMFEASRKKAKKQSDVDNNIRLAKEVAQTVKDMQLVPVMRTFYKRTAFQLPGDARVRISLDEDLTLIREDNWDGRKRAGDNWRRMDIGVDFPFNQLKPEDVHRFPYGVLEVKLQTQAGQEPPEWAKELVSSHLVEAVPKFSKFIHGCASLLDNRVPLVPFWLPQMEVNILKPEEPAKKAAIIRRPQGSRATPVSNSSASAQTPDIGSPSQEIPAYVEPVSDDEYDAEHDEESGHNGEVKHVANNEGLHTGLDQKQIDEAKAFREKHKSSAAGQPVQKNAKQSQAAFPKLTQANLTRLLEEKYGDGKAAADGLEEDQPETGITAKTPAGMPARLVEYISSFKAPSGKLVSVPIRIEPKVYFANERTFLSWLEFSVLISAIGVALMNFSNPDDPIGLAAGISFTFIALCSVAYAGSMFLWRALKIRARQAVHYDDRFGPSAVCAVLFLAVAINFIWRIGASASA